MSGSRSKAASLSSEIQDKCTKCGKTADAQEKTGSPSEGTQNKCLVCGKTADPQETGSSKSANMSSDSEAPDQCFKCEKTIDPQEKVKVKGMAYHCSCFKCSRHGCDSLSPSDWALFCGRYYCNTHLHQLISGQRTEGNKHLFKFPPRLITREND
ncbi:Zinc finger, LIM-type [Parasponia andersonii]|uniref:Zinc finger, LIM-type n=1 Tax=Parasponia andersonii TaxID=3476 RepID=A0A2P5CUR1_PARAD|nr:Zinc finger, LIM-type [Parasponia andersonii]